MSLTKLKKKNRTTSDESVLPVERKCPRCGGNGRAILPYNNYVANFFLFIMSQLPGLNEIYTPQCLTPLVHLYENRLK